MKKSERTKIKLKTIEILKSRLFHSRRILAKNLVAARSDSKLKDSYRTAAKGDLYEIHSDLFLLRAAEKQVPMPVKLEAKVSTFCEYWYDNGVKHLNLMYNAYCQNCGNKVDLGYKMLDGLERDKSVKYCPRCGQKLWWPRN